VTVDKALVDKLAFLAKLDFTEEEKAAFIKDFTRILEFVDKLKEIDTTGVEPLQYITDEVNVLRDDVQKPTITKEEALKNAPVKDSDYFKVPKVIQK
jgi:aspartyl-tRNA(Asn)/glutamyl-tRNA(Gln) amidotransferase subunit C